MTVDLGSITGLATALGVLTDGNPRPDWFADPARYLGTILTDDAQRTALVDTVDELLGGTEVARDEAGRTWLPVFENPPVSVYVVLDDSRPEVHVGLGARVRWVPVAGEVGLDVEAYVPLFAAGGSSALLLGEQDATVEVALAIDLPPTTDTGAVSLDRAELSASIPTWGPAPRLGLALRGLQLPGAASPRDVVVDAAGLDDLDDALLDLVLGLLHAATHALPTTDPARGLAGLLGLVADDHVDELPVVDVVTNGPRALATWWAGCLAGPARPEWLGYLAVLLGGTVATDGGVAVVRVPVGGATVVVELLTVPSAAGLPVVTPRFSVEVGGVAGSRLALTVDPVSVDLATGAAVGLPRLAALVSVGSGGPGVLLGPVAGPGGLQITVGSFEGGFALDADRRPVLVLAALDAVVGATPYERLDLTDGDALAGAAAQAVTDAAAGLLGLLGPLGGAVGILLGLTDPPGVNTPQIDPVALLADPLGAVRQRWLALLAEPEATVRAVLASWQEATAAAAQRTVPVTGDGSPADPYRVAVTAGVDLLLTRRDGAAPGSVVDVTLAATLAQPLALGAAARADVRVGLLHADLAAGTAALATGLVAVLFLGREDGTPLRLTADGYGLLLDGVGARIAWDAASGARVDPWLDGLSLVLDGVERPLAGIGVGGPSALTLPPSLPPEVGAWSDELTAALEDVAGALLLSRARAVAGEEPDAVAALLTLVATATGWGGGSRLPGLPRLSIAALRDDTAAELRRWVGTLLATGAGTTGRLPELVVGLLARLLGTSLTGTGVDAVPWTLALPGLLPHSLPAAGGSSLLFDAALPSITLALGPPTLDRFGSRAPAALVGWRPGDPGLPGDVLAEGISLDAGVDDLLADALAGRAPLAPGFDALVERWGGTDGVVALPDDLVPAGVTVHRPGELPHTTRLDSPVMAEVLGEVWEELGGVPARLVLVGVVAEGEPDLLPAPGAAATALEVDLTLADAPVEAFSAPGPAPAGTVVVRLAGKAGAAASGAGDGFTGQVARLHRTLGGLTGSGSTIVVVAAGAAGRPAVEAAGGLAGVTAVVTVASPWSPLSLDDVDLDPAAGALRMLQTLLETADADLATELAAVPEAERASLSVDDEDLALARGLVTSLLVRDGRGDPLVELSAPELPVPAGVTVHAVIGSCAPESVSRAITAAVASGLAARSRRRVAAGPAGGTPGTAAARTRLGLHVPAGLGTAAGGVRAALGLDVDVLRLTEAGIAGPALRIRLRIAGDGRWLLGGPDVARAPGPRPLAVRAATLDLTVALPRWGVEGSAPGGAVTACGRLVLHDCVAFGLRSPRRVVDLTAGAPLLPEVRALLGGIAAALDAAATADPAVAGLVDLLTALGVLDATGGFDATTLASLLADPTVVLGAALDDATRTASLAAGLRACVGDTRTEAGTTVRLAPAGRPGGAVTLTVDLATRTLEAIGSAELVAGGLRAEVGLTAGTTGLSVTARMAGGGDLGVPGPPAAALDLTATLWAGEAVTFAAVATLRDPRGEHAVTLWPAGPSTAEDLLALLPDAAAATALAAALGALRSTLHGLDSPVPADLVDAALDAAGLLRRTGGAVSVAWPSGLVSDPRAWIDAAAGDVDTALSGLLDAAAGLLPTGAVATPGVLPLAGGVTLRTAAASGRLVVALDIDATSFTGGAGDLTLGLAAGVSLSTSGAVAALPDLSVDLGAPGLGALRIRVGTDAGGADASLGVTVAIVPDGRPEIVIFPAAQGLAGLADAAAAGAVAALPPLLTRLAAEDPAGATPATTALAVTGRVVARAGRALGLASGTPAVFDANALAAFAADPGTVFAARSASLAADGLALVVDAARAALGTTGGRLVSSSAGRAQLSLGPATAQVVLGWTPGTGTLDAAVTLDALAGVDSVTGSIAVSAAGVQSVDVTVGPGAIPVGSTVTLAPFVRFAAGASRPGPVVDLGLGAGGDLRLLVRFAATTGGLDVDLLSATGTLLAPVESDDPVDVARAVVAALLDLAGGVVLGIGEVQAALGRPALGTTSAEDLLDGVLVTTTPLRLDATLAGDLLSPDALLRRLAVLVGNLADAMATPLTIGGTLEVRVTASGPATDRLLGLTLAVAGEEWVLNPGSDVQVGLVTDAAWISPTQPAGITLQAVRLTATGIEPAPGVVVGGVGVRFSKSSGPLVEAGITVDAVSLLGFGLVQAAGSSVQLGGGARVEIEGIGVPLSAGGDGSNPVAEGVMPSGGADTDAPAPRFSPALAVQQHPGRDPAVSLTAGSGSGPWFLSVQREFGPIYLEQVGLAVDSDGTRLKAIAVLIDGKVSLFGLSAAVDDLSFTYTVDAAGSPLDPARWKIDVAGFAVTADLSGLSLAGGLRKFTPAAGGTEYLGMLLARLGVYGITVYGGFGQVGPPDDQYSSMFLFGAVNGPIGGPPAFFVTGIGGGFGANRGLVVPADLSQFGTYPLIKALDPAARAGDPFTELEQARVYFPAQRGQFWFAAGISFTSFAVVDGVVVVAVAFGNGFELNILGLARMALPDEAAALVSIELALVARVSTAEGVVLVQAQLTDNSWLIAPAVRLTGGFAFAAWFAGANRGQFVLTLGGYHPDFHRDGYPVVPRLGIVWRIGSAISVTGESYFALTSEALMAGLRVEIHASIGPAWAHLVFGADGIVYFDPFFLKVTIYASIDAGITIDLWFAEVTFSVHLAARLTVSGPPFSAVATFEIGPASVTFRIGSGPPAPPPLTWVQFVPKYLEEASSGVARALAAITGAGTVPPAGGASSGGDVSPDGQPDRPFRVVAEFTATVTSMVPITRLVTGTTTRTLGTSRTVSVAPMGEDGDATPTVTLRLRPRRLTGIGAGGPDTGALDQVTALVSSPLEDGAYPVGVWGEAQDIANPKVPAGDIIVATDRVELVALADIPGTRPGETPPPAIPYRQVETGARRVNPLLPSIEDAAIGGIVASASALHDTLDDVRAEVGAGLTDTEVATVLLARRGGRAALDVQSWRAGLAAPIMLSSLGEGLAPLGDAATVTGVTPQPVAVPAPREPRVLAMLASGTPRALQATRGDAGAQLARGGTTVSDRLVRQLLDRSADSVPRVAPPTRDLVGAGLDPALPARLAATSPRARRQGRTMVATGAPPVSGLGSAGAAAVAARAASPRVLASLRDRTETLLGGKAQLRDGEVAVLELPDADVDTKPGRRPRLHCHAGRVRAVLLGASGRVLADTTLEAGAALASPVGTRTAVLVGGPPVRGSARAAAGTDDQPWRVGAGWLSARPLPSASDGLLVADGCVVDVLGAVPYRGPDPARVSWASPAELLGAERGVATTLAGPAGKDVLIAVAVGLTGSGSAGAAVGLRGARQVGDLLVTTDASGAGVAVAALDAEPGAPVRVTVATDPALARSHVGLVAVVADPATVKRLGPRAGAAWLAEAIAARGLDPLTAPPTVAGPGTSFVGWEAR